MNCGALNGRLAGLALRKATLGAVWAPLLSATLVATLLAAPLAALADPGHTRAPLPPRGAALADDDANTARVIVKYRAQAASPQDVPDQARQAVRLARRLSLPLSDGRVLGPRTQAMQGRGLSSQALAARLAQQPDVEWAVVDQRRYANAVLPNDPLFADGQTSITPTVGQWYLRAPTATLVSATNALGAWATTLGSSAITVAVLDTGVRLDHPDLAGKLRPGYDFVSRVGTAGDGDGRDGDPSDPGDWSTSADTCGAGDSSWHGTQVAGLIGAATDNGIGMAGIGRNVMVLPVRVLGKCGGFDSDIIAGMRWAAGVAADPYANPNPARVLNLSLGSAGTCSSAYRDAIAELTAARVAVVVAAGNDAGLAVNSPANCSGAIAVAGLRHVGTKVGYSNIGPQVTVAAPAGNCVNISAGSACLYPLLTTDNTGTTSPGANIYSDSFRASLGTSFATPLVAGSVGLMLSLDDSLTPAQISNHLRLSARPFPTTGGTDATVENCRAPSSAEQLECYCTTSTCGAGMLDTAAAVDRVQQTLRVPTAVIGLSAANPTVGQTVTLNGTGSSAFSGRSLSGYQWTIVSGANLASLVGATNGSSANLSTAAAGVVVLRLTVTDNLGLSSSATATVTVQAATSNPPSAPLGDSGGGALGLGWLLGLGLALWALRRGGPAGAV